MMNVTASLPKSSCFISAIVLLSCLSTVSTFQSCHVHHHRLDKNNEGTDSTTRLYLDDYVQPTISSSANPRKKKLKTFQRYLEIECWRNTEFRELEPVLKSVAESCKQINRIVQRAQTDDLYGVALGSDGKPLEETNIQGEVQQQLDVLWYVNQLLLVVVVRK
jgi:hypothetical protein